MKTGTEKNGWVLDIMEQLYDVHAIYSNVVIEAITVINLLGGDKGSRLSTKEVIAIEDLNIAVREVMEITQR